MKNLFIFVLLLVAFFGVYVAGTGLINGITNNKFCMKNPSSTKCHTDYSDFLPIEHLF